MKVIKRLLQTIGLIGILVLIIIIPYSWGWLLIKLQSYPIPDFPYVWITGLVIMFIIFVIFMWLRWIITGEFLD
jgi:hypothetical protein